MAYTSFVAREYAESGRSLVQTFASWGPGEWRCGAVATKLWRLSGSMEEHEVRDTFFVGRFFEFATLHTWAPCDENGTKWSFSLGAARIFGCGREHRARKGGNVFSFAMCCELPVFRRCSNFAGLCGDPACRVCGFLKREVLIRSKTMYRALRCSRDEDLR